MQIDWDKVEEVIRQYKELAGSCAAAGAKNKPRGHVVVTGGEPLVVPEILKLFRLLAAQAHSFSFALLTNGTLVTKPLAGEISGLKPRFVQVSIEGGQETHDRIRGPGSHRKAIQGLRNLIAAGVRTFISFTAHRGNYGELPAVCLLARSLGVKMVWAERLIPRGNGRLLADQSLTPQETREFIEILQGERIKSIHGGAQIATHRALQFLGGAGRPYRCGAGSSLIALMPDGRLYPCRRLPLTAGNIFSQSMRSIYFNSKIMQECRVGHPPSSGCEDCSHWMLCGGGLRCLSYAVFNDARRADPGCWLRAGGKNSSENPSILNGAPQMQ